MPSIFTSTVMFETSREALLEEEAKLGNFGECDGGLDSDLQNKKRKVYAILKQKNNKRTVGALALAGTAAVIAVTAMSFGDVQCTMDNISVLDTSTDLPDMNDCCTCIDDCQCECLIL